MTVDHELDAWREQWQAGRQPAPDLRRRVERQSRWMRIALASEIAITIVLGGVVTGWAVLTPQVDIVLLAAVTWVFFVSEWTFGMISRRDNGGPRRRTHRHSSIFRYGAAEAGSTR